MEQQKNRKLKTIRSLPHRLSLMPQLEISYGDIQLLRSSQYLLGNSERESFQEHASKARAVFCLEEQLLDKVGKGEFDRIRTAYRNSPEKEGQLYTIEVTLQQETIFCREVEPLKQIESIIGKDQFDRFCRDQGAETMSVSNPAKQLSLDENGQYKFAPSISPVELERQRKAAYLLGDNDAKNSANAIAFAMQKTTGMSWTELVSSPNHLYSPIISAEFKNSDLERLRKSMGTYNQVAERVGGNIVSQLLQYREAGGDIKINSAKQIDVEPNEDGSLKVHAIPPDGSLIYNETTPRDVSQWVYAAQVLGLSSAEKTEMNDLMEQMVDTHNKGGVRDDNTRVRGEYRASVKSFADLQANNSTHSYEVITTSSQIERQQAAQEKLATIKLAYGQEAVSALFRAQMAQGADAPRIVDLGQIKKTPNGLEVTPIKEFRTLPVEVQEARNQSIEKIASTRRQQIVKQLRSPAAHNMER